jgi:hypothetical protein
MALKVCSASAAYLRRFAVVIFLLLISQRLSSAAAPPSSFSSKAPTAKEAKRALIALALTTRLADVSGRRWALTWATPKTTDGNTVEIDIFKCQLRERRFVATLQGTQHFAELSSSGLVKGQVEKRTTIIGRFDPLPNGRGWRASVVCTGSRSKATLNSP